MGGERREKGEGEGGWGDRKCKREERGERRGRKSNRRGRGGTDLKERMIAMWGVCPSSNDKLKHPSFYEL